MMAPGFRKEAYPSKGREPNNKGISYPRCILTWVPTPFSHSSNLENRRNLGQVTREGQQSWKGGEGEEQKNQKS